MRFLILKAYTTAAIFTKTNIVIGNGSDFSATYGAPIVQILAKKLQMPIAVDVNKVGNRSVLEIKHKLKVLAVPSLVNITNMGIQE